MSLAQRLDAGLAALEPAPELPDGAREQLIQLVELLAKWNQAYNLTAVREPEGMVERHILDSLAVLPWLDADQPTLDIGTGAGLPGLVLAIARPDQAFTLLDANSKKTRFVKQAVLELKLARVEVVQARVEQYRSPFPRVISRAFSALPAMIESAGHLVAPGGRLLAMKSAPDEAERAGIPAGWHADFQALSVPGIDEPRQLVILHRAHEQGEPT
jgi:16S rRNA (guanine527-N7)-methyltransferase